MPDDGGLYTIEQMSRADALAVEHGVPGIDLMENAGAAVADAVVDHFAPVKTVVLCGPGNNGGDGLVTARRLVEAGWPVRVALLGEPGRLKGDAAIARERWTGRIEPLHPSTIDGADLAVDALFGAGLSRPLAGRAKAVVSALVDADVPVVAVDMPSGVDGDSGAIRGAAPRARITVTFHRPKPGHFLLPGRDHVGLLVTADIGIPDAVDQALGIDLFLNLPSLWSRVFPQKRATSHKYDHGHALILGGGVASTGAARLAARAALRAGAGLVTVLCPTSALVVYASTLTAVMTRPFETDDDFARALADQRRNAILLGPGAGVGASLEAKVEASLGAGKSCVLDADALTSFADRPDRLFRLIEDGGDCLLTPHQGEFNRLFAIQGGKLARARSAAGTSGATVLLKGADTVVAAPDGRASILTRAPATLATAGSGDVLAGIALGLIAQSMPVFEAASAAAWLHAAAADRFGPGLIAEDLADCLPPVLAEVRSRTTDRPAP